MSTCGIDSNNSSRWLTEEVFKLIDIVKLNEAIYNPRHKYYFCRPYVENFWREVDLKLEKNPGASLAKWTNLRISFRREYTNYLEEKVPPCWSYFDRMFFLHPYLRKKHQQSKSLDSQMQDALVQISSLSNRLQRERVVAAAASAVASFSANHTRDVQAQQPTDNYLEYFDDPEQNNSEIDEILDEEQQSRFQNLEIQSLNNDIKSECEDTIDEYETEHDQDDSEMQNYMLNSLAVSNTAQEKQRQQVRLHHLKRLQSRTYEEVLPPKRPRSQESISSSQSNSIPNVQRVLRTSTPTQSNVSFVRPTFSKPMPADMVTTTSSHAHTTSDGDLSSSSAISAAATTTQPINVGHSQTRHLSHHRLEISAVSSGNNMSANSSIAGVSTPATHLELCDCKTDPDAMFLMSLLPDIQKLNGRDRGKIKIAFQNILQDYLYPD